MHKPSNAYKNDARITFQLERTKVSIYFVDLQRCTIYFAKTYPSTLTFDLWWPLGDPVSTPLTWTWPVMLGDPGLVFSVCCGDPGITLCFNGDSLPAGGCRTCDGLSCRTSDGLSCASWSLGSWKGIQNENYNTSTRSYIDICVSHKIYRFLHCMVFVNKRHTHQDFHLL